MKDEPDLSHYERSVVAGRYLERECKGTTLHSAPIIQAVEKSINEALRRMLKAR